MAIIIDGKKLKTVEIVRKGVKDPLRTVDMSTGEVVFDSGIRVQYTLLDKRVFTASGSPPSQVHYYVGAADFLVKNSSDMRSDLQISFTTVPDQFYAASVGRFTYNLICNKGSSASVQKAWQTNSGSIHEIIQGLGVEKITFSYGKETRILEINRDWNIVPEEFYGGGKPVEPVTYLQEIITLQHT